MKLSVAMATYNGEKYIIEQLESIMMQNLPVDEVIICDDKSSDDTVKLVRAYIKKHGLENWHITVNNENIGYIKNFYKAISETTGDYIFLCDQDDIWESDKTEKMVDKMQETDACAINSSFSPITATGEFIRITDEEKENNCGVLIEKIPIGEMHKFTAEILLQRNISHGCTMCITKELKNEYLKFDNNILPHDYLINLIAAIKDGLYFYNEPLIRYRLHDNNTIGAVRIKYYRKKKRIKCNELAHYLRKEVDTEKKRLPQWDYREMVTRHYNYPFDEDEYKQMYDYRLHSYMIRLEFIEAPTLKKLIQNITNNKYRYRRICLSDWLHIIIIDKLIKD